MHMYKHINAPQTTRQAPRATHSTGRLHQHHNQHWLNPIISNERRNHGLQQRWLQTTSSRRSTKYESVAWEMKSISVIFFGDVNCKHMHTRTFCGEIGD